MPKSKLDATVKELAEKLYNKLPECTRYTKQQLNFWRDLSWSMTIGHARDWLTLHAGSFETAEGLRAFKNKEPMDYPKIHCKEAGAAPISAQLPKCVHALNAVPSNQLPLNSVVHAERKYDNDDLSKHPHHY